MITTEPTESVKQKISRNNKTHKISSSSFNELAIILKNKHIAIVSGVIEKYRSFVTIADNELTLQMQSADIVLKDSLSQSSTSTWAKCSNATDLSITEMLKNIKPDYAPKKPLNPLPDSLASSPEESNSNAYTKYRHAIIAAIKTHSNAIETHKKHLHDCISKSHNDLIHALKSISDTDSLEFDPYFNLEIPSIDAEFEAALSLSTAY